MARHSAAPAAPALPLLLFLSTLVLLAAAAAAPAPAAANPPAKNAPAAAVATATGGGRCPFASMLPGATSGFPADPVKEAYDDAAAAKTLAPQIHPKFGAPSSCSPDQYRAFAQAIVAAIKNGTLEAPKTARLAFHTSFPYSPASPGIGGPNGAWASFPHELEWAADAGLDGPLKTVKAINAQHPCLTLADAMTFAGTVALEFAGGPPTAWIPGRRDALSHPATGSIAVAARLPDGGFNALSVRYCFSNAGFSVRDTVALIGGGHSMGGMDSDVSGWNGTFSPSGDVFPTPKNRFFIDLTTLDWVPMAVPGSRRTQFVPKPSQAKAVYKSDEGKLVARLPSDMALLDNRAYADLVRLYARDEATFMRDYARAYQRMLQQGAGGGKWDLMPEKFVWLGLTGKATNYGTSIAPM